MTNSNVVDVNGKEVYIEYVHKYDDKPTLVFLHDSLGCTQLWRDFPKKLAEKTQTNILVYDRVGYGKSSPMETFVRPTHYMELEADFLNDLLLKLNSKNAILFGHSDGGTIALLTASKYPDNIKAVICEAGHIFVEDVTLKGVQDALKAYKTTNLPERLAKYHGDKVEMLFKAWTETWLRDDYRSWNVEHFLQNITCPLLFIQGENDEYGTLKQVEKTISQVSGSAVQFIIPEIGHTPHKELPEVVLAKTTEFINSL